MAEHLKSQFFVIRQNNSIVPLIAMDELPHHVRIEGVPRTMTLEDTVGMINVGKHPSRHRLHHIVDTNKSSVYAILTPNQARPAQVISPEEDLRPLKAKQLHDIYQAPPKSYGIEEQPPSDEEVIEKVHTSSRAASHETLEAFDHFERLPGWKDTTKLGSRLPPPGKKEYCSHWISTGECDYAQQGCLYKHEMPFDLELLNHLGFRDIPTWYRELHGIGKLTATPGSGASFPSTEAKQAVRDIPWRTTTCNFARRSSLPANRDFRLPAHKPDAEALKTPSPPVNQFSLLDHDLAKASASITPMRTTDSLLASKFAILKRPIDLPAKPPQPRNEFRRGRASRNNHVRNPENKTDSSSASGSPEHTDSSSATTAYTPRSRNKRPKKAPFSRRSSIYSDPEADLIRANDLRLKTEAEEYEKILKAKKEADIARAQGEGEEAEKVVAE